MKKKNLVKHYFALVAMLFVVSGSGNTVKLVALSDEGNNNLVSNALTSCSFCNLGEDEDFYNVSSITETFSGKSPILKKVYPSFISNKTASNFYSQAPPHFS